MFEISDLRIRLFLRDKQYEKYQHSAGEGALLTDEAWEDTRSRIIKDMHFTNDTKLLPWAVSTRDSSSTYEGRRQTKTVQIKDGTVNKNDADPDARTKFNKHVREEFWEGTEIRHNVRAELGTKC